MSVSHTLKTHLRTYTMIFALVAIWVIFQHATDGAFLQARNISNLMRQMSVTGTLAAGMVLVIVAGQIDLSVGSVAAFLGGILAVLSAQLGWSPTASLLATLVGGVAIGLIQGYLLSYQKIPAFIVTLGGMMAFRGAAMWVTSSSTIPLSENWILSVGSAYLDARSGWVVTVVGLMITLAILLRSRKAHQKMGLPVESTPIFSAKMFALGSLGIGAMAIFASYEGIPVPVLLMLGILIAIHLVAAETVWGRHVYAIGGNTEAALLSGVKVKARILSVFGLMGFLSAVGAIIMTTRVGSASPDAGQLLELDAIAACVIGGTSLMGGKGSVFGALLGALVIESLNNGMSLANMEPFWQFILKGLVLVAAVWVDVLSRDRAS